MPTALVHGLRIGYDDLGTGEPALLLMPGWCDSRTVFRSVAPLLAEQHRVFGLDWRGHGRSAAPDGDFGYDDLLDDALGVVERSGADRVVPVAASHAGWAAIALRRKLRRARIPGMVFLDWIVLEPPPPFIGALEALQKPGEWRDVRDQLFRMWLNGLDGGPVPKHLEEVMSGYDETMWARAGREISRAYARDGAPIGTLRELATPSLHLYAQPSDPAYLRAQQALSEDTGWFQVERLEGQSHFPALERPEAVAAAVLAFTASLSLGSTSDASRSGERLASGRAS
jgi:pimeloyl-ACP methyl ester carboxylesterase